MPLDPEPPPFLHVLVSATVRETTLADDPSKRGSQDRSRINTSEDYEMCYWSRKLGVSPGQLEVAVRKVGSSVKALGRELKANPVHSR
jgi:hypothetical protein